ncbi:MAG: hypothetical protein WED00_13535 [Aquisalimonadaceae bacterium]
MALPALIPLVGGLFAKSSVKVAAITAAKATVTCAKAASTMSAANDGVKFIKDPSLSNGKAVFENVMAKKLTGRF